MFLLYGLFYIKYIIKDLKGEDRKLDNAVTGLLNMLLISIPEGLVISFICLLLLNDKNMLDFIKIKKNFKNYLILILPQAIVLNFMQYILGIDSFLVKFFVGSIVIVGCLAIVQKKFRIASVGTVLVCYIILAICETLCVPPILKISGLTMQNIDDNMFLKFLIFLPERILQLSILFIIILRYNIDISKSILSYILQNKTLRVLFLFIIGFNIYEIIKAANNIRLFIHLASNMLELIMYIVVQLFIPIFNIFTFFFVINYFRNVITKLNDETENIEVK